MATKAAIGDGIVQDQKNKAWEIRTSWGRVRLRPVQEADAAAIVEIYAPYVLNTAISFEDSVPSVAQMVERIHARAGLYPFMVAEIMPEGEGALPHLIGYAYASAFHERSAYRYCAELSIYLAQQCRQGGVGRALYECIEQVLRLQGFTNLYACIAYSEALANNDLAQESNPYLTLDSVHFHERMGYKLNGVFHRCGYKFGCWFDMCWMEKLLEPLEPAVQPCAALLGCDEAYARLGLL